MAAPQRRARLVLSGKDGRGAAARSVLRFHLRSFRTEEEGVRAGEVEPVHQLRVATRRLRAALRLFKPVLPVAAAEAARKDLAWLGRGIGSVRDLDVLALVITTRARRLDPELRAGVPSLVHAIRVRRAAAHAELLALLDSSRCRSLLARLAALGDDGPRARRDPPLGDIAADLLQPHLVAVIRVGRGVDRHAAPDALHRVRVRVKRLRYALETMGGLGGTRLEKALGRLVALQELLGEHQDAITGIAWLRTYAENSAPPAATLLALGALIHVLGRRARRLRRRFPATWRKFDRRRLQRRLLDELTRVTPVPRDARVLRLVRRAS